MPERVPLTVYVDAETFDRIEWAAVRRAVRPRDVGAELVTVGAQALSAPPPPRRRRQAELREAYRQRTGGPSPVTEALQVIRPGDAARP